MFEIISTIWHVLSAIALVWNLSNVGAPEAAVQTPNNEKPQVLTVSTNATSGTTKPSQARAAKKAVKMHTGIQLEADMFMEKGAEFEALGDYDQALICYRTALNLYMEADDDDCWCWTDADDCIDRVEAAIKA